MPNMVGMSQAYFSPEFVVVWVHIDAIGDFAQGNGKTPAEFVRQRLIFWEEV